MSDLELARYVAGQQTRWASFENPTAGKGVGGRANRGQKGAAFAPVAAGETVTLARFTGPGAIRRLWLTIRDRSPQVLRGVTLEMFWDGALEPAVACPLGDFFGFADGRPSAYESELFSSPEGRSFVCYAPMPFADGAIIRLTNELDEPLTHLFYDVDATVGPLPEGALRFHANWRRERPTTLGRDFELLPRVTGRGRFLGVAVGVQTDPVYGDTWWGEGEVKVWLDGDRDLPTLVGTGTEDYLGTGWGQGRFAHRYQGCLSADGARGCWSFYRQHIPDPIWFETDCRVTIQQIGGGPVARVRAIRDAGGELRLVSGDLEGRFIGALDAGLELDDPRLPETGWVNFQRRDDWAATAWFYLDRPINGLPPLAPVAERVTGLD